MDAVSEKLKELLNDPFFILPSLFIGIISAAITAINNHFGLTPLSGFTKDILSIVNILCFCILVLCILIVISRLLSIVANYNLNRNYILLTLFLISLIPIFTTIKNYRTVNDVFFSIIPFDLMCVVIFNDQFYKIKPSIKLTLKQIGTSFFLFLSIHLVVSLFHIDIFFYGLVFNTFEKRSVSSPIIVAEMEYTSSEPSEVARLKLREDVGYFLKELGKLKYPPIIVGLDIMFTKLGDEEEVKCANNMLREGVRLLNKKNVPVIAGYDPGDIENYDDEIIGKNFEKLIFDEIGHSKVRFGGSFYINKIEDVVFDPNDGATELPFFSLLILKYFSFPKLTIYEYCETFKDIIVIPYQKDFKFTRFRTELKNKGCGPKNFKGCMECWSDKSGAFASCSDNFFKGKIVIVGSRGGEEQKTYKNPEYNFYGFEAISYMIQSLIDHHLNNRLPDFEDDFLSLILFSVAFIVVEILMIKLVSHVAKRDFLGYVQKEKFFIRALIVIPSIALSFVTLFIVSAFLLKKNYNFFLTSSNIITTAFLFLTYQPAESSSLDDREDLSPEKKASGKSKETPDDHQTAEASSVERTEKQMSGSDNDMNRFVAIWWEIYKEKEVSTPKLYGLILKNKISLNLGSGKEASQKNRLREKLSAMKEQPIGDYRFERAGKHGKAKLWRLKKISH